MNNKVKLKFTLDEDFVWNCGINLNNHFSYLCNNKEIVSIDKSGNILVRKGYMWDGCSPKINLVFVEIGTWDGDINLNTGKPETYYASLIHDVLYQFRDESDFPFTRKQIDNFFYELLKNFKYKKVYYWSVRIFGGFVRKRK